MSETAEVVVVGGGFVGGNGDTGTLGSAEVPIRAYERFQVQ